MPLELLLAIAVSTASTAAAGAESSACPTEVAQAASSPTEAGLLLSAAGYRALQQPGPEAARRAVACLQRAQEAMPQSAVVARDLAAAWVRLERWAEADEQLQLARALGAGGPDLELLAAVVAARRGDFKEARKAGEAEGSWRGALISARLGSPDAKGRLLELLPESTRRSVWARIVLSLEEGAAGDWPSARQLAADAAELGDKLQLPGVAESARRLGAQLDERGPTQARLRLRSVLEYTTNPGFAASGGEPDGPPLRVALTADGGIGHAFGRWRTYGAARIDQHLFLSERDETAALDLFSWSVAAGLRYALSADPNGAAVGLVARYRDVYGDRFGSRIGQALEGGPELNIRMAANVGARLAIFGLLSDYIDGQPPSGVVSAVNRDRVGLRALFTVAYRSPYWRLIGDATFLRDQADGEAFDAVGGGLGARLMARAGRGVWLHLGWSGLLREFGPVGDAAVIGDAAVRAEFRSALALGARWRLNRRMALVIENVWISTAARQGHRYSDNVLTLGVESQW